NARTDDGIAATLDPVVLDGVQRVDGFEFGVSGRLTERWRVIAGYTYLNSEVVKSRNIAEVGNALANVAPHNVSLWTTYDLSKLWQIGGGAQFVDQRYTATTNTTSVPGYYRFDATVARKITDNVDLRLNIYNLTDEEYFDKIHPNHFVPGAGRAAVLTTSF